MKTFKTFIAERESQALNIVAILKSGAETFDYVNDDGELVQVGRHAAGLIEYVENAFGAKKIGQGFYSSVISGPPSTRDFVLKINKNERDKEYLHYAKVSQQYHSHNSMFPRILHIDELPTSPSWRRTLPVYIIEGVEVGRDNITYETIDMLQAIAYKEIHGIDKHKNLGHADEYTDMIQQYENRDQFLDWCGIMKQEFGAAAHKRNRREERVMIDIKHANLGFRKDGSLVMLDPVA